MQHHSENSKKLTKSLGDLIRQTRKDKGISCTKFAYQYDIDKGNLNRIENGIIDSKFTTLWKISEALGIKLADLIKELENELDEDFKLDDCD